ncbi:MAG: Uncharacterized MFS-type transporter, partial [uncultured Microvirga sp.]
VFCADGPARGLPGRPRPVPPRHRHGAADARAGRHHREHRPAEHPARAGRLAGDAAVDHQRLHPRLRRAAALRRPGRRPVRETPGVPRRPRPVRPCLAARRAGRERGDADRRPRAPGHRGGADGPERPGPDRHQLPGGQAAQLGHGGLRRHVGARHHHRRAARRGADGDAGLAVGLLHQHPHRPGGARRERG